MDKGIEFRFSIGDNDFLRINLEDLVNDLQRKLCKERGKVVGEFKPGEFTIRIMGHTIEEVQSWMDPFIRSMKKRKERFFLNQSFVDLPQNFEEMEPGTVKGKTLNRQAVLTNARLTGRSLNEILKKDR
jgi:hypothetical protein